MARVCPNYETRFNLQVIQLKGKDAIVTDGCLAARIQVLTEPVEETLLAASNFKPRAQQWEIRHRWNQAKKRWKWSKVPFPASTA
ncbi:MAG: hypothetical protein U0Y68_08130 [Blastocatellia bacterium]